MAQNRFDSMAGNDEHLRFSSSKSRSNSNSSPASHRNNASMRMPPFKGNKIPPVIKSRRKTKISPPPKSERDFCKSLLPNLNDGGRWTLENEGYGWKIRRIWEKTKPRKTKRFLWIRWAMWNKLKGESHESIRQILAEKITAKSNQ